VAQLASFAPTFPAAGQHNFARDAIAAFGTSAKVSRYFPSDAETGLPTDDHALAHIENSVLKIGGTVVHTEDQDDAIHVQVHSTVIQQGLSIALEGQGDVQGMLPWAQAVLSHITTAHLAAANRNGKKELAKQITVAINQIQRGINQLTAKIQKAQADQQKTQQAQSVSQGLDPDSQIKLAKAQQEMQIKQAETTQRLKQREQKFAQEATLRTRKAELESQLAVSKPQ